MACIDSYRTGTQNNSWVGTLVRITNVWWPAVAHARAGIEGVTVAIAPELAPHANDVHEREVASQRLFSLEQVRVKPDLEKLRAVISIFIKCT